MECGVTNEWLIINYIKPSLHDHEDSIACTRHVDKALYWFFWHVEGLKGLYNIFSKEIEEESDVRRYEYMYLKNFTKFQMK